MLAVRTITLPLLLLILTGILVCPTPATSGLVLVIVVTLIMVPSAGRVFSLVNCLWVCFMVIILSQGITFIHNWDSITFI